MQSQVDLRKHHYKVSGGDGIPVELFQILKDDIVKVLHSICQQIWKTQQWPQDWKRSVFIPIPKKSNAKECSNYCTIARISHASKVMLKILQARLQQHMNLELPDGQVGFRNGRGTWYQIANICCIMQKASEFQKKHLFLLYWLFQSLPERDGNTRPPDLPLEKSMQVRKQPLELVMEQQTGSRLGKEYIKAAYCHLASLTYMQSTSWETLGWSTIAGNQALLELRLPGEISITSDMQVTPPFWRKGKKY